MSFKSILTVVTNIDQAESAVKAASAITRQNDAHLDILVLGVDRTQVGYSYVGSGAVLMQAAMERAELEANEIETRVSKVLAAEPSELRASVETGVTQIGLLNELIAQYARFADLVVLPKPYGRTRSGEAETVVESSLFEGNAPVLIIPEEGLPSATPRRIVIAWNQSSEAMTSVRRALPLLKSADLVSVTVIDPPPHGPERSDPGGMLCQMLVRHGVKAEVSVLAKTMPRISEVLARHACDIDADMVVMGAYGHSRFREAILGGATRNTLEKTSLPIFMAH